MLAIKSRLVLKSVANLRSLRVFELKRPFNSPLFGSKRLFSTIPSSNEFHSNSTAPNETVAIPQVEAPKISPSEFTDVYANELDYANVLPSLKPLGDTETGDIIELISKFTPSALYTSFDEFTRVALSFICDDLGLGMGWSIVICSLLIKFSFLPIIIKTQLNAIKMKKLEPETKNFQQIQQKLMRTQDQVGIAQARAQFKALRKKHKISTFVPILSMLQIPVMISWFLSLRYVSQMPDKFPGLHTDGFLWFQDLSAHDPYMILPVVSSLISFFNITISMYNANSSTPAPLQRYMKYFRFMPFLSIPIVVFFPASINLYWVMVASFHLSVSLLVRSKSFQLFMGIPEYLPNSILEKINQRENIEITKVKVSDPTQPPPKKASRDEPNEGGSKAEATKAEVKEAKAQKSGSASERVEIYTNKPMKKTKGAKPGLKN